jgi:ElaB/YqjD/DUF883 family membrane-anchored ribosome-binding protein
MSLETERIEADVTASRHRLNDTLDRLGHKLSPGQMLDEVLGLARGRAGQFTANLGRQLRDNPVPALLIGAGIGALLLRRGNGHARVGADDWRHERRYRSLEETRRANPRLPNESDEDYHARVHEAYAKALDLKQMADEGAHDFKERVSKTVSDVQHAAKDARERLGHAVSGAVHLAQDQVRGLGHRATKARQGAQHFYEDTPLAAGAIALAIGALIGAGAPLSTP